MILLAKFEDSFYVGVLIYDGKEMYQWWCRSTLKGEEEEAREEEFVLNLYGYGELTLVDCKQWSHFSRI